MPLSFKREMSVFPPLGSTELAKLGETMVSEKQPTGTGHQLSISTEGLREAGATLVPGPRWCPLTLLELDAYTSVILDLLDHLSTPANDHTN